LPNSDHTDLAEATLLTLGRQAQVFAGEGQAIAEQIVTVTSAAEAYIDGVLGVLISECDLARHPFIAQMYAHMEDLIFQSWTERFRWLGSGFGVSIKGTAAAQDMQTLVELRNSIVHGGGRLTERQSRNLADLLELERRLRQVLDVSVERRRIRISDSTFDRAIRICRTFVVTFDDELRTRHPKAKL
jgi:hypothetical protein